MSQFFMHEKNDLVNEAIEGVLLSTPWHNLSRLDLGDEIRVVVRSDWDKSKVALISGGGSGHEPAHAGFVGKGMLTAAVCGDIFASPSVDAVLNAIVNVTGDAGCLLIVKNYTGDRLNFGLAAEKAKNLGYKVELVMVQDDIALPENPQPRGIAGTVLVHKIAGFAAEQGQSLDGVKALAQRAIDATSYIGLAFATCHVPGEKRDERVAPGHSELGMGIHGEPGVITLDTQDSRQITSIMTDKLAQALPDGKQALLLINNLGGFSQLELALLTREVLQSPLAARITHLLGPATLVSALDMKGFSLTLLALEEPFLEALNAPVQVLGWVPVYDFAPISLQRAEKIGSVLDFDASENAEVARIVASVTQTLIDLESELNALDAKVGDGDTGSTFAAGAKKIQRGLQEKQLPLDWRTAGDGDGGIERRVDVNSVHQRRSAAGRGQRAAAGLDARAGAHETLRRRAAGSSYVGGCAATGAGSVSGGRVAGCGGRSGAERRRRHCADAERQSGAFRVSEPAESGWREGSGRVCD